MSYHVHTCASFVCLCLFMFGFLQPRQEDDWSCGHRCVLALRHILSTGSWPPSFPDEVFSEAALEKLCSPEGPRVTPQIRAAADDSCGDAVPVSSEKPLVSSEKPPVSLEKPPVSLEKPPVSTAPEPALQNRKSSEKLRQAGLQMIADSSVGFNEFQYLHRKHGCPLNKGDYQDFCRRLVDHRRFQPFKCTWSAIDSMQPIMQSLYIVGYRWISYVKQCKTL